MLKTSLLTTFSILGKSYKQENSIVLWQCYNFWCGKTKGKTNQTHKQKHILIHQIILSPLTPQIYFLLFLWRITKDLLRIWNFLHFHFGICFTIAQDQDLQDLHLKSGTTTTTAATTWTFCALYALSKTVTLPIYRSHISYIIFICKNCFSLKRYVPSWIIAHYAALEHVCISVSLEPAPHHLLPCSTDVFESLSNHILNTQGNAHRKYQKSVLIKPLFRNDSISVCLCCCGSKLSP